MKEIQIEQFNTHGSWRKYRTCFKGLHGEVKAECGQCIGPGAHVLGSIDIINIDIVNID